MYVVDFLGNKGGKEGRREERKKDIRKWATDAGKRGVGSEGRQTDRYVFTQTLELGRKEIQIGQNRIGRVGRYK